MLGGDGSWDYLTIDPAARRLYIARETRVTAVDMEKKSVTTADGRAAKDMESKFRQINKFVEVLEHLMVSNSEFQIPNSTLRQIHRPGTASPSMPALAVDS